MDKIKFFEKHTDLSDSIIGLLSCMPDDCFTCVDEAITVFDGDKKDLDNFIIHTLVHSGFKHDLYGRELMDPVVPPIPKGCKVPDSLETLLQRIYRNPELEFRRREGMVFAGVDEDLERDDEYFEEQETPWEIAARTLCKETASVSKPVNKEPVSGADETTASDGANEPAKPVLSKSKALDILAQAGFDLTDD